MGDFSFYNPGINTLGEMKSVNWAAGMTPGVSKSVRTDRRRQMETDVVDDAEMGDCLGGQPSGILVD